MTDFLRTPRGNVRAVTISTKRTNKAELEAMRRFNHENYPPNIERPMTRGECQGGERPCPFVSCKWHLAIDVSADGSVKLNFPHLEVWELPETCALDVADRGDITLEDIGTRMNITRERIRQIEALALRVLNEGGTMDGHRDEQRTA